MSSSDFFTRLERQLVEAAERDVAVSPARRRLAGLADRLRPGRLVVALPIAAGALLVGVIAAVVLSLGEEQPRNEAGRGALPQPTDGLTVGPLGTAPPTGTATPRPLPGPNGLRKVPPATPYGGVVPIPTAPSGTPSPIPAGTSVFVLNGTTRSGVAAATAKRLETLGATVEGTGNASVNTTERSVVYSATGQRGRAVAGLLGLPADPGTVPRKLSLAAGGADVVVLLGADYLDRKDRQVKLTGKGGASGVAVLPKRGGLSLTGSGLPPSNRYFLWVEGASGGAVPVGFATYDKRNRRVAGITQALPSTVSSAPLTRVFLTREKTDQPKRPGQIVLDSGRISG